MTTTAPAGIPATGVPHGAPEGSEQHAPAPRGRRRIDWSWLGLVPFAVYLAAFLVLPTVFALATGFVDGSGALTGDNLAALVDPVVLATFANSTWVSLLTALIGAVVGALVCLAMLGLPETGIVRTTVDAASGVLAQFGGDVVGAQMRINLALGSEVRHGFDAFDVGFRAGREPQLGAKASWGRDHKFGFDAVVETGFD